MMALAATPATRAVAQRMIRTAREQSAGDAVLEHLGECHPSQSAALLRLLLQAASGVPEPTLPMEPAPLPMDSDAEPTLATVRLLPAEEERLAQWAAEQSARFYQVTAAQVLEPSTDVGGGRPKNVVRAAHAVQWVLRTQGLSMPRIAELTGRRDHTTVLAALRGMERHPDRMRVARMILAAMNTEEQSA